jgi:ABC-2 type transport system ATP-binding protein
VSAAVSARALSKRFGQTEVLRSLDIQVEAGELYALIGPNGAGKTTAFRIMLGLVAPTSGSVEILGRTPGPDVLRRVGAMVEEPSFWPYLTGRKNLEYFSRAGGRGADTSRRLGRIDEALEMVSLSGAGRSKVRSYSQGMRQRLGIALALLGDPDVLILDEPTNGLDPRGIADVRGLFKRLRANGRTVIVATHLLQEVSATFDRIGVIVHGRLVAEGTPRSLMAAAGIGAGVPEGDGLERLYLSLVPEDDVPR